MQEKNRCEEKIFLRNGATARNRRTDKPLELFRQREKTGIRQG